MRNKFLSTRRTAESRLSMAPLRHKLIDADGFHRRQALN
jgi:hypothetical protein